MMGHISPSSSVWYKDDDVVDRLNGDAATEHPALSIRVGHILRGVWKMQFLARVRLPALAACAENRAIRQGHGDVYSGAFFMVEGK